MQYRLRTLMVLLAMGSLLAGAWLLWQWQLREAVEAQIIKLILILPASH